MYLRAVSSNWTTGEVATLMAIAAFRRRELFGHPVGSATRLDGKSFWFAGLFSCAFCFKIWLKSSVESRLYDCITYWKPRFCFSYCSLDEECRGCLHLLIVLSCLLIFQCRSLKFYPACPWFRVLWSQTISEVEDVASFWTWMQC